MTEPFRSTQPDQLSPSLLRFQTSVFVLLRAQQSIRLPLAPHSGKEMMLPPRLYQDLPATRQYRVADPEIGDVLRLLPRHTGIVADGLGAGWNTVIMRLGLEYWLILL